VSGFHLGSIVFPLPKTERGKHEASWHYELRMERREQILGSPTHMEEIDGRTWLVRELADAFAYDVPEEDPAKVEPDAIDAGAEL